MKRIPRILICISLLLAKGVAPGPGVPSAYAVQQSTDMIGESSAAQLPADAAAVAPDVSLAAGVLVTPDGRELWSRSVGERRAMASTTKIMTAIVVLENAALDETLTVDTSASRVGESVAGIKAGEVLTVGTLLEGMLVKSGNDAAEALAVHVGGTEEAFVQMMNDKAAELGLSATHFDNPHGLDSSDHYTTARDLSVLARYAMGNDEFRRIVAMPFVDMDGSGPSPELENSNTLIGDYVGATGIKTGWTDDAGYCLAASATRHGIELVAIVLGARTEEARFAQAETLLDWGFEHYSPKILGSAEETLGAVPVTDYIDVEVPAILAESVKLPVFDFDGEVTRELALEEGVEAPVTRGDRVGTLTLRQGDRLLAQVDVVAGSDIEAPGFFERVWIAIRRGWIAVTGG